MDAGGPRYSFPPPPINVALTHPCNPSLSARDPHPPPRPALLGLLPPNPRCPQPNKMKALVVRYDNAGVCCPSLTHRGVFSPVPPLSLLTLLTLRTLCTVCTVHLLLTKSMFQPELSDLTAVLYSFQAPSQLSPIRSSSPFTLCSFQTFVL